MAEDIVKFLKENWQWFATGFGLPTFLVGSVKMCYKFIFPMSLKVFKVEFGLRNYLVAKVDGMPITLSVGDNLEGYFSITAIRKPKLNEFTGFYIEIPALSKTINGNLPDLLTTDKTPQVIEVSVGLLSIAEQELWKSKLIKGTEVLIKIKAGWRNPLTIRTHLS